jgi:hypothetical protein
MISKYFLLENEQYSRVNIAYNEAINKIPIELQILEPDRMIIEIFDSIKLCTSELILKFQIKLLSISLNKEIRENLHISFSSTLRGLDEDEILILQNVHHNNYEFIETCDYEPGKGFYDYKYQQFDYPKDELLKPANFEFYIHHLQDVLKIIRWPIYKQDPITENGTQTGLARFSRLIETAYGVKFNRCLFDCDEN